MNLPPEARDLLAKASVVAEAPGVSFIPSGRHEHDTKAPTTGTGTALLDRMRRRFEEAATPSKLAEEIAWARAELKSMTNAAPKPKWKFKERVLVEWEGHSCEAVAEAEGIHRTTIYRWRRDAGLNPSDGREMAA